MAVTLIAQEGGKAGIESKHGQQSQSRHLLNQ